MNRLRQEYIATEKISIRVFGEYSSEEHDYVVFNMDSGHEQVSKILQNRGMSPQQIKKLFEKTPLAEIIARFISDEKARFDAAASQLNKDANFEYSPAEHIMLQDSTVEMVFSLSPYGYHPLNKEIHRVLKKDGIVVVGGNDRNPFANNPFAEGCKDDFEKLDFMVPIVKRILKKIGSQTTHGNPVKEMIYTAYIKKG